MVAFPAPAVMLLFPPPHPVSNKANTTLRTVNKRTRFIGPPRFTFLWNSIEWRCGKSEHEPRAETGADPSRLPLSCTRTGQISDAKVPVRPPPGWLSGGTPGFAIGKWLLKSCTFSGQAGEHSGIYADHDQEMQFCCHQSMAVTHVFSTDRLTDRWAMSKHNPVVCRLDTTGCQGAKCWAMQLEQAQHP